MNIICCHCGAIVELERWQKLRSNMCGQCVSEGRKDVVGRAIQLDFTDTTFVPLGDGTIWTYSAREDLSLPPLRRKKKGRPLQEVIPDSE